MIRSLEWHVVVLLVLGPVAGACAGPAEEYVDAELRAVGAMDGCLAAVVSGADDSASRLLAGGHIYLAGERGMVSELLGRAGGLCAATAIRLDKPLPALTDKDVVLWSDYGLSEKPEEGLRRLAATGALVIAFCSVEHPLWQQPLPKGVRRIGVSIPCDSRLVKLVSGQRLIPLAPPAIATAQWTYVAELIGACRRQNRQLAVYLSILLDEGHRRYERTKGLLFEPDLRPEPVARGEYARRFLASVREGLQAVRQEENLAAIRKAASWIKEAEASHHQIVRNLHGHLPPAEVGLPGDPPFFTAMTLGTGEEGVKWIRENLRPGDLYLFLGYQRNEEEMSEAANALGARTIFLTSQAPSAKQAGNPRHLYVNPHWPRTDACLELAGYDVKACPLSCILGLTCYYAICGEVVGK